MINIGWAKLSPQLWHSNLIINNLPLRHCNFMRNLRKILEAVFKETDLPTDLLTYWRTDSGEIIGTFFPWTPECNNFSWVTRVPRILEFDCSRLTWTWLTKTNQKHLINLMVLRMSSHMIITRYLFKFEKSWM